MGPINAQTLTTNILSLGDSTQNAYRELELGDWGESSQISTSGSCDDIDLWLVRAAGVDYLTSQTTSPAASDNITVVEFDCTQDTFGAALTWNQNGGTIANTQQSFHVHKLGVNFGGFDIGDMSGDGVIDVVAINDANTENVSYATITQSTHTFSPTKTVYFGPYIAWEVTVAELNGDGEPDFVHAAKFKQSNSTSSTCLLYTSDAADE